MVSLMLIWSFCLIFLSASVEAKEQTTTSETGNLKGLWVVDKKLSDDPDDKLKGKLRKRYQTQDYSKKRHPGSNRSAPDVAMNNYWETLRHSEERKASKNLKRLGPAFFLLTFQKLNISEIDADKIALSYDDSPGRMIKPNKDGRIYSAKGAELTQSFFGHTLSYYLKGALILETDAPDGGKYIEKLSIENGKLNYKFTLDSLVLKETISINRQFLKQ